jgi:hypothetical protein
MTDAANNNPNSNNPIVKWLGLAAAIVGGVTALVIAIQHFEEAVKPAPFPQLAATDVGNITGSGHTVMDECEKQRQIYALQNPNFDIAIDQSIQPSSNRDILGAVTYTFHCHFIPTRK